MALLYLLYQSVSGYALFSTNDDGLDEIGQNSTEARRNCISDLNRFGKVVQLTAFHPFDSALEALNQCKSFSEGIMTDELRSFLVLNLPKVKKIKKAKFTLGVADPKIGSQISKTTNIHCQCNEFVLELLSGVHMHFDKFIKDMKPGDLDKAKLGMGHSYSRAKVKFNVNCDDILVIQAIFLLDTLDKDINCFSMIVRECYSCHFPELVKIVKDNYLYARVAKLVEDKSKLSEDNILALTEILGNEDKAKEVVEAGKESMGQDLSPIDLNNVQRLAHRVIELSEVRKKQYDYLVTKMNDVAPNLASLVGEVVGARLISRAGSLRNLAKCPGSTLQFLGCEEALCRALKSRANRLKGGLIFHSSFIGRASGKNKGRMARYLSNKCSIASRIDFFAESTTTFGKKLREQVNTRLDFYEKEVALRRSAAVMTAATKCAQGKDEKVEDVQPTEVSGKKSEKKKSKDVELENGNGMDEDKSAAGVTNGDDSLDTKSEKKKLKLKLEQDRGDAEKDAKYEVEAEEDAIEKKKNKKKYKEVAKPEATGEGKKKRKFKDGDGSLDTESEKEKKKKKKRKSEQDQGDAEKNAEDEVEAEEDAIGKKKKKKNKEVAEPEATGDGEGKKKKKKKSKVQNDD